jgi:hypothetical protein
MMKAKARSEVMIKDALYNLDARSGASEDYCKGLLVGVVSAWMAAGLSFQDAIDEVARLMPHAPGTRLACPEPWKDALAASLKELGVVL